MKILSYLKFWHTKPETEAQDVREEIKDNTLLMTAGNYSPVAKPDVNVFAPYTPPPGVVPAGAKLMQPSMAMDYQPTTFSDINYSYFGSFKGYPYLATRAQAKEYRAIIETLAEEYTRKFIKLRSLSDDKDKGDKISELTLKLSHMGVAKTLYQALVVEGTFGRCQLYIDVDTSAGLRAFDDDDELSKPLFVSPKKIPLKGLRGFKVIEPFWTYPGIYNSTNPLADDFYSPQSWYVMAKTVHASRLINIVSNPVPDILKPAYSFGGLSQIQMLESYVENWITVRDSIKEMVKKYSYLGIKTDLQLEVQKSGTLESKRAEIFNNFVGNHSLMMLDKDNEDFFSASVPLTGLEQLSKDSQEQMCSMSGIPVVKLLGSTPSGMNASSDGEIEVFYDRMKVRAEMILRPIIKRILDILQISEYAEIDDDITFEFVPLKEMTEEQIASINKTKAETDQIYVSAGILSPEEPRVRLASEKDSHYDGIDEEIPYESFNDDDGEAERRDRSLVSQEPEQAD